MICKECGNLVPEDTNEPGHVFMHDQYCSTHPAMQWERKKALMNAAVRVMPLIPDRSGDELLQLGLDAAERLLGFIESSKGSAQPQI